MRRTMTPRAKRRSRGWPALLLAAFWVTAALVPGTNAVTQTITIPPFAIATGAFSVDVAATFEVVDARTLRFVRKPGSGRPSRNVRRRRAGTE